MSDAPKGLLVSFNCALSDDELRRFHRGLLLAAQKVAEVLTREVGITIARAEAQPPALPAGDWRTAAADLLRAYSAIRKAGRDDVPDNNIEAAMRQALSAPALPADVGEVVNGLKRLAGDCEAEWGPGAGQPITDAIALITALAGEIAQLEAEAQSAYEKSADSEASADSWFAEHKAAEARIVELTGDLERLRQDASAPGGEVEGWRLVPIEPTQEMLAAAETALSDWRKTLDRDEAMMRSYQAHDRKFIASATPGEKHAIRYRAMLAAAPAIAGKGE